MEELIQVEVERRVRLLMVANADQRGENSENNSVDNLNNSPSLPAPPSNSTAELAPSVARLMGSAGGGPAAAERAVAAGNNADIFSFELSQLKRYLGNGGLLRRLRLLLK